MRRRSYTPSPPRGYGRRGRSPSPRGRYAGGARTRDDAGSRDDPTTLLVRNLRHDCRPEDLKKPFGQFGPVKDIYLPRDYYTRSETTKSFRDFNQVVRVLLAISSSKRILDTIQVLRVQGDVNQSKEFKVMLMVVKIGRNMDINRIEPRGFGFIQYLDPADAGEAKYQMDGQVFQGRQLTVVFAEENRKKPTEMRARERGSGRGGRNYDRRGTPPRYHNSPRYSRSPPARSRDYQSPAKRRQYSRSVSPEEKRYSRERSYSPRAGQGRRSYSQSPPPREQSPPYNGSRSRSPTPVREQSPPYNGSSRSPVRARSPVRGHSRRQNPSQSRSRSPDAVHYSRNPDRDVSPRR